jgi:predicted aminopeptidase
MPYKGFFTAADARKERAKLEKKGLDVWIRGVDAFSTLGWFKDPLYSYMRDYSDYHLADLIIHELLHATVFVRGQAAFNEQLAELTGRQGGRLYIESRCGSDSPEYRAIESGEAGSRAFRLFLRELGAELESLYDRTDITREAKLAEKETIIRQAQRRFNDEYERRFQNDDYRFFTELPVNNAYLDLYRLYHEDDNFLDELFNTLTIPAAPGDQTKQPDEPAAREIRRLRAFIAAAAKLNDSRETRRTARRNPREALRAALTDGEAEKPSGRPSGF